MINGSIVVDSVGLHFLHHSGCIGWVELIPKLDNITKGYNSPLIYYPVAL